MRAAPPVQVHVASKGAWQGVIAVSAAGVAASCFAWAAGHASFSGWMAAAVGLAVFATTAAWVWRRPLSASGALRWDGAQWRLDGRGGAVGVMLDLDLWMLLRFDAAGRRPAWLAVGRREAGGAWHALRAAVYSRRPNKSAE